MADTYAVRLRKITERISRRNIDPDLAADCDAEGGIPITAWALKGTATVAYCGHHLTPLIGPLTDQGWEIIPVKRTVGAGVGTEATPNHYSVGG